ncbi:hypothetical protein MKX01_035137 [Papaver californicum]|nr:hypothetical protein MKX01_035137 [Papaver californicum]
MASQITLNLRNAGTSDEKYSLNCFGFLTEGNIGSVVVRVTRKWEEFDFMFTHGITSVDLVIVDAQGYELHVVIPQNLIYKFADELIEGRLYSIEKLHLISAKGKFRPAYSQNRGLFFRETCIAALEDYPNFIVPNKFHFTEFEMLGSKLEYLYLSDVVAILKTITNFQS